MALPLLPMVSGLSLRMPYLLIEILLFSTTNPRRCLIDRLLPLDVEGKGVLGGGNRREREREREEEWKLISPLGGSFIARTHARVDFHEGVKDIYGGGC